MPDLEVLREMGVRAPSPVLLKVAGLSAMLRCCENINDCLQAVDQAYGVNFNFRSAPDVLEAHTPLLVTKITPPQDGKGFYMDGVVLGYKKKINAADGDHLRMLRRARKQKVTDAGEPDMSDVWRERLGLDVSIADLVMAYRYHIPYDAKQRVGMPPVSPRGNSSAVNRNSVIVVRPDLARQDVHALAELTWSERATAWWQVSGSNNRLAIRHMSALTTKILDQIPAPVKANA